MGEVTKADPIYLVSTLDIVLVEGKRMTMTQRSCVNEDSCMG